MHVDEVMRRVEAIRSAADDPEAAHAMEDDLRRDVLRDIVAQGRRHDPEASSPYALAEAALLTEDEDFPRWCA